ncbi:CPBP family intramembrane metalloprotease [soil metagenome]
MDNFSDDLQSYRERNPWGSFFLLIFFVLCGLFVGQLIGFALVALLFDFDITSLQEVLVDSLNHPEARIPLYILQGSTAIGAFIVAPLIYLQVREKKNLSIFFLNDHLKGYVYLITFFIVLTFMMVNSIFIEWNAQLTLPEFMRPFEEWAYEKEQQAKLLTQFLTNFENFGQYLLGILIIAVIPAIGEELLFRGLIQNQMHAITKHIHLAIWITGFLFSAMHLQFYGLIPRMLLGVLFGYMYYWSGNLIMPIFAHFINNGFTLTMLYLYQLRTIDYDLETETTVPWYLILSGLVAGSLLLIFFRNYFRQKKLVDG